MRDMQLWLLMTLALAGCKATPAAVSVRPDSVQVQVDNDPCQLSASFFSVALWKAIEEKELHPDLIIERRIGSPAEIVTAAIDGFHSTTGMQGDGDFAYGERFTFGARTGVDVFVRRVDCSMESTTKPLMACQAKGAPARGTADALNRHAFLFQTGIDLGRCGRAAMRGRKIGESVFAMGHQTKDGPAESIFIARNGYEWFVRVTNPPGADHATEREALRVRVLALLGVMLTGQPSIDAMKRGD